MSEQSVTIRGDLKRMQKMLNFYNYTNIAKDGSPKPFQSNENPKDFY